MIACRLFSVIPSTSDGRRLLRSVHLLAAALVVAREQERQVPQGRYRLGGQGQRPLEADGRRHGHRIAVVDDAQVAEVAQVARARRRHAHDGDR